MLGFANVEPIPSESQRVELARLIGATHIRAKVDVIGQNALTGAMMVQVTMRGDDGRPDYGAQGWLIVTAGGHAYVWNAADYRNEFPIDPGILAAANLALEINAPEAYANAVDSLRG